MLRVLLAQDKLVFAVSGVTLMHGVTPIIMILSNQNKSQYHATYSNLYLLQDRFEYGW